MSDARRRLHADPHERFGEWLLVASDEDPPRDLAVHASLCEECQQMIRSLDMLAAIDPRRAGMPPVVARPIALRARTPRRLAVSAGGVAALAVLGVGGWRVAEATGIGLGSTDRTPTQAVLDNTGHPAASQAAASASPTDRPASATPSPSAAATLAPTPAPTYPVFVPTPRASPRPTRAATPTAIASASPSAAPSPTPVPTLPPTPEPPTPTPDATPAP